MVWMPKVLKDMKSEKNVRACHSTVAVTCISSAMCYGTSLLNVRYVSEDMGFLFFMYLFLRSVK